MAGQRKACAEAVCEGFGGGSQSEGGSGGGRGGPRRSRRQLGEGRLSSEFPLGPHVVSVERPSSFPCRALAMPSYCAICVQRRVRIAFLCPVSCRRCRSACVVCHVCRTACPRCQCIGLLPLTGCLRVWRRHRMGTGRHRSLSSVRRPASLAPRSLSHGRACTTAPPSLPGLGPHLGQIQKLLHLRILVTSGSGPRFR